MSGELFTASDSMIFAGTAEGGVNVFVLQCRCGYRAAEFPAPQERRMLPCPGCGKPYHHQLGCASAPPTLKRFGW